VHAEAGFRLVAAMNPFDAVGTERISSAIYDRTCRISMDYQSAETESDIVALNTPDGHDAEWRARVVDLVRRTRDHPDVRIGSSVRGAIDMVAIAGRLVVMRAVPPGDWHAGLDAALVALSGRIRLHDSGGRRPEEIVRELYDSVFGAEPSASAPPPDGTDPGEA
jgi:MoxR-like ATPase